MKKIFSLALATLISFAGFSQVQKPIEVQFKMLENKTSTGKKEIAMSVSIINHTDKAIYIPGFDLFASFSGVHFYQKEGKVWKEINIDTHTYQLDPETNKINHTTFYDDANSLSKKFSPNIRYLRNYQDSLLKAYTKVAPKEQTTILNVLNMQEPLFLKPGQRLDNYFVKSLDYLLTKKMIFKISFNSEPLDSLKYYRGPYFYSRGSRVKQELPFPTKIFGYQVYYPKSIGSNVLIFNNNPAP
ncbi:hypothetical protein GM921_09515 [Pedobacter sp. LMG 31464]|uniref:DUF3298 domain-containing protein n=1 Tax=Pedobacter planticolens TaxID=2679964 RepID=A0A923IVC7_9SPHI|nr:hypothetical protein [Pedobacter planticolens]MBB2145723.1 hypothetical protein [Pedobacter planticolens]